LQNVSSCIIIPLPPIADDPILDIGYGDTYTPDGEPGARSTRADGCHRGGYPLTTVIALPTAFVEDPLFRRWSGESQKLYFWLRARVGHEEPGAPDDYHQARDDGFLAAYATADDMMERAVDCSRNTLTKLIRELADLGVAQVRPSRRGYVFLLGETFATLRWHRRRIVVDAFYLDQLVGDAPRIEPAPASDPSNPG